MSDVRKYFCRVVTSVQIVSMFRKLKKIVVGANVTCSFKIRYNPDVGCTGQKIK